MAAGARNTTVARENRVVEQHTPKKYFIGVKLIFCEVVSGLWKMLGYIELCGNSNCTYENYRGKKKYGMKLHFEEIIKQSAACLASETAVALGDIIWLSVLKSIFESHLTTSNSIEIVCDCCTSSITVCKALFAPL